ncbi:hypothetical protein LguiA_017291 [Lonicera macranthoides]
MFDDFQMVQRQIMLKQLQELQMQQQFQELGDPRQQNYINQQSMMNKQASGAQLSPLINATPIQEFSNALTFSQDQSKDLRTMGLVPQPFDVSSYENRRLFPMKTTNICPSDQDLDSLDPLEQKILFNTDDNSFEASFGGTTGGLEHTGHLSAFPSLQSGSWSALMQSAVAEATSSDTTGLQEEWSGLSYQNPDLSTDNQPLNFVDSGNQHTSWADDNLQSASLYSNSSGFSGFQQSGGQISFKQSSDSSSFDTNPTVETSQHMLALLHKVSKSNKSMECRPGMQFGSSDSTSSEVSARDFEAFGQTSKPTQNYSLLHQIHTVKNEKADLSRVSDKHSGVDLGSSDQVTAIGGPQSLYEQNLGCRNPVKSELQFSFAKNGSQCHSIGSNVASNRTEQSKISLQMAPTWFNHYGTLKNEQIRSMHDARAAKNTTQQFSLGKQFENFSMDSSMMQVKSFDASQVSSGCQATSTNSVAVTHLAPSHVLPPDVTDQTLAVLRPKKRKIAPFELLPWHNEVTQGSQRLQNIRMAELEWAKAVNRQVEKVEHETQIVEDNLPMLRPKKRLILTTQLMQQLFRPAINCVSAAYVAARLALADACSLLTSSIRTPRYISDISSKKPKPSGRINYHDFSKSVEDFIKRIRRLEGELSSLDMRASVSDIRVESQELNKFSVINRLAKFHSRGPSVAAETSKSSGRNVNMPRMFLQRYVQSRPMPKTVPEGARCTKL